MDIETNHSQNIASLHIIFPAHAGRRLGLGMARVAFPLHLAMCLSFVGRSIKRVPQVLHLNGVSSLFTEFIILATEPGPPATMRRGDSVVGLEVEPSRLEEDGRFTGVVDLFWS